LTIFRKNAFQWTHVQKTPWWILSFPDIHFELYQA